MRRASLFTAGILLLVGSSGFAQDEENPLNPILKFGKQLDDGIAAFLSGKNATESFPKWTADNPERAEKVREKLKEAGITSAANLGIELDLIFLSSGKPIYRLSLMVSTYGGKVSLVGARGRSLSEKGDASGSPLAELTGPYAPLTEAAKSFLAAIGKSETPPLSMIDADLLKKVIRDEKIRGQIDEGISKSREKWHKAWTELKAAAPDEVQLRIDDQVYLALDADGVGVGTINMDFDMKKNGILEFDIRKYRPFKRDEDKDKEDKKPERPKNP